MARTMLATYRQAINVLEHGMLLQAAVVAFFVIVRTITFVPDERTYLIRWWIISPGHLCGAFRVRALRGA